MFKNLKISKFLFFLLILFSTLIKNGQEGFYFKNDKHTKEKISFRLINNLIVVPLKINGVQLSFILDTGSDKTILFKLSEKDSIGLNSPEKVKLRGLGVGEPVDALISRNNIVEIDKLRNDNQTVFVILKDFFDLSSKMGTTIHGIIGYSFFRNFVVNINYRKRYLKIYKREDYIQRKCRKCEEFQLRFYRKKPYLKSKIQFDTVRNRLTDVKLLIDTGGSDAIWLFEGTHKDIVTPKRYFNDILGEGLSGTILGKRSRVNKFKLGNFSIDNPTVSFLDSTTTHIARNFKLRNGSIGGNILSRFNIWLDYRGKSLILRKNKSFNNKFNYNMSGIDVVYEGKRLIRERINQKGDAGYGQETNNGKNSIFFETKYSFKFRPSIKINTVVENSPADKVGLMKDDIILSLNDKPIYTYKIEEIIYKFSEKENKKIKLKVLREGKELTFKFSLEKRI